MSTGCLALAKQGKGAREKSIPVVVWMLDRTQFDTKRLPHDAVLEVVDGKGKRLSRLCLGSGDLNNLARAIERAMRVNAFTSGR